MDTFSFHQVFSDMTLPLPLFAKHSTLRPIPRCAFILSLRIEVSHPQSLLTCAVSFSSNDDGLSTAAALDARCWAVGPPTSPSGDPLRPILVHVRQIVKLLHKVGGLAPRRRAHSGAREQQQRLHRIDISW